jgi:hypothetical protein
LISLILWLLLAVFFAKLEMPDGSVFSNAFINTHIFILNRLWTLLLNILWDNSDATVIATA